MTKVVRRFKDWFKGYDEAPLWLLFCRLIFAISTLAFLISFFGPAILGGDVIGFWMYQSGALSSTGLIYIVIVVTTFMLAILSGIPTIWYERKRMRGLVRGKRK